MLKTACLVAALALACVLVRAARVGMAGDYVDPVGKIAAEDEARYANGAIRMAQSGGWLTPRFMGRLALDEPPLLYWLSGAGARIAGRLPRPAGPLRTEVSDDSPPVRVSLGA